MNKPKSDGVTQRGIRSGLRSGPYTAVKFEDNPESLLSKSRSAQKSQKTKTKSRKEHSARHQRDILVETALIEEHQHVSRRASSEFFSEVLSEDTDIEEELNRAWDYSSSDEDTNPNMAKVTADSKDFPEGLEYRNVSLEEKRSPDPCADHVQRLTSKTLIIDTDEEQQLHDRLWNMDQIRCSQGSNEALFQRTLMMSLIARHSFIYNEDAIGQRCLDYSVEVTWICSSMPTRAHERERRCLTQPKPDLAVCFRREALIPNILWTAMPRATRMLACNEGMEEDQVSRIFHFFTIEAKKEDISPNDTVGKRQSLNNASQALHNMYEFCRDAGPQHEKNFFSKVRFFSVVASIEGLVFRIHRAHKLSAKESFVIKDYPLSFEYQEFAVLSRGINFQRRTALDVIRKILIGYGTETLRHLLSNAAKALMRKLRNDEEGRKLRGRSEYYRYG